MDTKTRIIYGSFYSSPCCDGTYSKDPDTGIPVCSECGDAYDPETGERGHAPACDCGDCETERALDEAADTYFEIVEENR